MNSLIRTIYKSFHVSTVLMKNSLKNSFFKSNILKMESMTNKTLIATPIKEFNDNVQGERDFSDAKCYNCGQQGHISKNCTEERKNVQEKTCYNCGQAGHLSRDCQEQRVNRGRGYDERPATKCYTCGETGHMSRECPQSSRPKGRTCYNCGSAEHMARECPEQQSQSRNTQQQPQSRACYNCGVEGHMSRDCPSPPNKTDQRRGGVGPKCYTCGQTGHMSRDCPN